MLRTLAAEGLTDAERDVAVQNLVGVAPLKYETAAAVASTLADQVEQHLPDDYQATLYRQLAATGTVEATAAAVSAFPVDRLVTVLVGDAAQIKEPGRGPRHRRSHRRHRPSSAGRRAARARRGPGCLVRHQGPFMSELSGEVACLPCGDALQKSVIRLGIESGPLSVVRAVRQAVRRTRGTGQSSPSPRTARARGAGDPPQSLG